MSVSIAPHDACVHDSTFLHSLPIREDFTQLSISHDEQFHSQVENPKTKSHMTPTTVFAGGLLLTRSRPNCLASRCAPNKNTDGFCKQNMKSGQLASLGFGLGRKKDAADEFECMSDESSCATTSIVSPQETTRPKSPSTPSRMLSIDSLNSEIEPDLFAEVDSKSRHKDSLRNRIAHSLGIRASKNASPIQRTAHHETQKPASVPDESKVSTTKVRASTGRSVPPRRSTGATSESSGADESDSKRETNKTITHRRGVSQDITNRKRSSGATTRRKLLAAPSQTDLLRDAELSSLPDQERSLPKGNAGISKNKNLQTDGGTNDKKHKSHGPEKSQVQQRRNSNELNSQKQTSRIAEEAGEASRKYSNEIRNARESAREEENYSKVNERRKMSVREGDAKLKHRRNSIGEDSRASMHSTRLTRSMEDDSGRIRHEGSSILEKSGALQRSVRRCRSFEEADTKYCRRNPNGGDSISSQHQIRRRRSINSACAIDSTQNDVLGVRDKNSSTTTPPSELKQRLSRPMQFAGGRVSSPLRTEATTVLCHLSSDCGEHSSKRVSSAWLDKPEKAQYSTLEEAFDAPPGLKQITRGSRTVVTERSSHRRRCSPGRSREMSGSVPPSQRTRTPTRRDRSRSRRRTRDLDVLVDGEPSGSSLLGAATVSGDMQQDECIERKPLRDDSARKLRKSNSRTRMRESDDLAGPLTAHTNKRSPCPDSSALRTPKRSESETLRIFSTSELSPSVARVLQIMDGMSPTSGKGRSRSVPRKSSRQTPLKSSPKAERQRAIEEIFSNDGPRQTQGRECLEGWKKEIENELQQQRASDIQRGGQSPRRKAKKRIYVRASDMKIMKPTPYVSGKSPKSVVNFEPDSSSSPAVEAKIRLKQKSQSVHERRQTPIEVADMELRKASSWKNSARSRSPCLVPADGEDRRRDCKNSLVAAQLQIPSIDSNHDSKLGIQYTDVVSVYSE